MAILVALARQLEQLLTASKEYRLCVFIAAQIALVVWPIGIALVV